MLAAAGDGCAVEGTLVPPVALATEAGGTSLFAVLRGARPAHGLSGGGLAERLAWPGRCPGAGEPLFGVGASLIGRSVKHHQEIY